MALEAAGGLAVDALTQVIADPSTAATMPAAGIVRASRRVEIAT